MNTFRNILSDYLIRCNHLQIIGESIRQNIAKNKYTQYETIFERLDKYKKGYLIPADLGEFMLENNMYPNEGQLYVIFRELDQNRIGTVTIEKLKGDLLPRDNPRLAKEVLQRKYYTPNSRLQIDLEYQLMKYFEHQIRVHTQLQEIRLKLNQIYLSYPEQAFSLLDRNKLTQIIPADIDFFLRSNGKVLKSDQINRIFRVLSKNPHEPKLISYDRFLEHIHPFGRGYYSGYAQRLAQKDNLEKEHIARKVLLEDEAIKNERREIQARLQLESLRNSRRQMEQRLLEKEMQIAQSRVLEQSVRRNFYY